jgi:hypothetical protein
MKNSKLLICFAAAMFCSVATAESLKFKFAPGDKYSLVSITDHNALQVVDGNEQKSEENNQLECSLDIEEVDENGFAWAKYTYKRFTMKLRSESQKFSYDSDANQLKIPVQALPWRVAMGESVYLRITPQGRIEKINGLQALITIAKSKIRNITNADTIIPNINRQFAEATVRRELENQLAVFPDSNESDRIWNRKEILSSEDLGYAVVERVEEVNTVIEKTFRLNPEKSARGGVAVLDVNLVIKPASTHAYNPSVSEAASRPSREVSGEGFGQIEIEEATGRVISNKSTRDIIERIKFITPMHMIRPPPGPEPLISHIVTTFQMTKTVEDKPTQPADTNDKGA